MFGRKSKPASPAPMSDTEFQMRIEAIKAKGRADRKRIAADKIQQSHELCPWSTSTKHRF